MFLLYSPFLGPGPPHNTLLLRSLFWCFHLQRHQIRLGGSLICLLWLALSYLEESDHFCIDFFSERWRRGSSWGILLGCTQFWLCSMGIWLIGTITLTCRSNPGSKWDSYRRIGIPEGRILVYCKHSFDNPGQMTLLRCNYANIWLFAGIWTPHYPLFFFSFFSNLLQSCAFPQAG